MQFLPYKKSIRGVILCQKISMVSPDFKMGSSPGILAEGTGLTLERRKRL